ncbi:HAD-IA family hydrolase [Shimia aestuarii]|uniref:Phosphoglycolate phosphatase n=1 Tax=Shimia aestuarii TaxID=254406 RepID=A0A1I4PV17_9RHOB|nr:HAD-IA family hydrolase [Shimia aestuarii]SFM31669.1 phosphoglycolate phosphatase [Shimia aestuarii]
MSDLRLVVFDVDGTLVDSQADILGAMMSAFEAVEIAVPEREDVLGIVGLSLPEAMERLAPDAPARMREKMVEAYKSSYMQRRRDAGTQVSSPLYPGAAAALARLRAVDEVLLGVATGKSRRGLDKLIEGHGLQGIFVTEQVADHHPSKPHPAMLHAAMRETGVAADASVMIGDTSFDMEMARAAGMRAIGVSWGYHDRKALQAADVVIDRFDDLDRALEQIWE